MAPLATIACCILCWISWRFFVLPKYQTQDTQWGEEYRERNLVAKERAAQLTILFWSIALIAIHSILI
tara:strand:+ start:160 stop:363 length:204 start_codon:yes stop_codon:yes gene_type:complete